MVMHQQCIECNIVDTVIGKTEDASGKTKIFRAVCKLYMALWSLQSLQSTH
jgi:hypothetical protein